MSKRNRTLDSFFGSSPPAKKLKQDVDTPQDTNAIDHSPSDEVSLHETYPFALPHLPPALRELMEFVPASEGRAINDQPHLDLLYFQPFLAKDTARHLFEFLRRELFFYKVKYTIKRGPVETQINTPRYTTVFGIDETARFDEQGRPVDATSGKILPSNAYKCKPRPIPDCLDTLRRLTENATGWQYNYVLVNYYADGDHSISYHSDDERFLGPNPAIASFSLGAKRDFLLKHKPTPQNHESEKKPMTFPLSSGDAILMRGTTQSNWLHSIPKRKRGESEKGRINLTFRRNMVKSGTENYYRYNVGDGAAHKWNAEKREMVPWHGS